MITWEPKRIPHIYEDPDFRHAKPKDYQLDRELMWRFEEAEQRIDGVTAVMLLWGVVGTVLIAAIGVCFFVQWKISH